MPTTMLGLRTTIYKVDNLDKAKAWYARAFQAEPYFDDAFYVGFNVAGYELGLMKDSLAAGEKTANVLTYWGVDEIDAAFSALLAAGATADTKPVNVGGEIMVASVKDPWGNVIGIIYNPEFALG